MIVSGRWLYGQRPDYILAKGVATVGRNRLQTGRRLAVYSWALLRRDLKLPQQYIRMGLLGGEF